MKIIKEGFINQKEKKKQCSKCRTVFTYTNDDIKYDFRDGDYINCPKCNSFLNADRIYNFKID